MQYTKFWEPFPHWLADGLVDSGLSQAAYEETPANDWDGWRHYDNDCERGKRVCSNPHRIGRHTVELFDYLNSRDVVNFLSELSGILLQPDLTLHGAGIHVTAPGGHLNPHLDYSIHPHLGLERRLNLVLFLNPKWGIHWGGEFLLYNEDGEKVVSALAPSFNRLVLWLPGDTAFHGTAKVSHDCPDERVTAAVYYLSEPRPGATRRRALFIPNRSNTLE